MLATLTESAPKGGGWIYEPKLDGVRVLAYVTGGVGAALLPQPQAGRRRLSRAGGGAVSRRSGATRCSTARSWRPTPRPGSRPSRVSSSGCTCATWLGAARTGVSVELYLFDCLFYEGIDLTGLPLLDRKKVLRDVVWYDGPIRFTPYRTTGSAAMYREACAKGAEGILAKRAESRYTSGRSTDWLKIKCVLQQEFVVGGYTAPQGAREHLGALLVGYYDGGTLRYAGKVGTGYDRETLELLHRKLAPLRRRTSPFAPGPVPAGEVQWVTPKLVAQIGFGEWTEAGLLRHPRYLGLRDDKAPREVRRE